MTEDANIGSKDSRIFIRGEIWTFSPEGFSHRGDKKNVVSWLIISGIALNEFSDQLILASITSQARGSKSSVLILKNKDNGLRDNSSVVCTNICTVDKHFAVWRSGSVTLAQLDSVDSKLRNALEL